MTRSQYRHFENIPFGRRLYRAIRAKGMNQTQFCAALRLDRGRCSEYVNEKRLPSIENVVKYARFLECSVDFLLGLSDEMKIQGD